MKIEIRFSDAVDSGIVTPDSRITEQIASNLIKKGKAERPIDSRTGDGRWLINTDDIENFDSLPTAEQRKATVKATRDAEMEHKKQDALKKAIETGETTLYHWNGQIDGNGGTGYYVNPDGTSFYRTYSDE